MSFLKQLKIFSLAFLLAVFLTAPFALGTTTDLAPRPAPANISGLADFAAKYGETNVKKYGRNTKLEISQGKVQEGDALDIAAQVLHDAASVFGYEPSEMMFGNQIDRKDGSSKMRFCQTYKGVHVYGTCLIVVVDRDKRVQSVQCQTEEKIADVTTTPRIDSINAMQVAKKELAVQGVSSAGFSDPRLMVLTDGEHSHLVWWLRFNSAKPQGSWVALVDAVDATMVLSRNKLDTF